ncbi:hypothetical protein [Pyxidicoccus sp. MSG2]|uniref:monooxygenase n=1 Tax=Pyxidicoccus sp. MSG2 TaxID=2996790 RepID=UPI002270DCC5|nr:hypothetical protein [Pyxidicoccus sp. MSG2]MCY1018641.1 hypothetical protein [Pyxidicoccus sp. MSG2]
MNRLLLTLLAGVGVLGAVGCAKEEDPGDEDDAFPLPEIRTAEPEEGGPAYSGGPVTWHHDVAPIVQRRCQGCHAEGGMAPFAMKTFPQASARHAAMATAVTQLRMPPWMPAPGELRFKDSRRLTRGEVAILSAWSTQGAPEGDPATAPPPEPAPQGLGWVDTHMEPAEAYVPNGTQADDYHCFLMEPGFPEARDVIGFEVRPGARHQVHHVLLFNVPEAAARQADASEPGPGWTCFGDSGVEDQSVLGAWAPGTPATRYPEGTGVRVPPGTVVVMQVHYNLNNGPRVADRTGVDLQFARAPVANPAALMLVASDGFAIPAGGQGYRYTFQQAVPSGRLWGVIPHMHTLGRRIVLQREAGTLIDIPAWDFHWQQMYFYEEPVEFRSARSRLQLSCIWDNPTPRTVRWGEGTQDEMCLAYLYVTR